MCSYPSYLVVFEVTEEYPASFVDVVELEERLLDVRRCDLHGRMKGWVDQILQVEPPATQGTWALLVSMQRTWSATSCSKSSRYRVREQTCSCYHRMEQSMWQTLARLIADIHHTSEFQQKSYVGNTAQQCTLGLFQDSDFPGDLEDSKSTSGRLLCAFSGVTRSFPKVGCVRIKRQFHTAQQKLNLSLSTQVYGWMEFPFSIFGNSY